MEAVREYIRVHGRAAIVEILLSSPSAGTGVAERDPAMEDSSEDFTDSEN